MPLPNSWRFYWQRLARSPGAHLYHYAPYEKTALRRLASMHATAETAVDEILRTNRMVDLYRVVREGVRIGEPGYSIKNLERFYMPARTTAVVSGGDSLVIYDRFRETGESSLLNRSARLQSGRLPLHASSARLAHRTRQENGPLAASSRRPRLISRSESPNQRTTGGRSVKKENERRQRSKRRSLQIQRRLMPRLGNSWPTSLASIAERQNRRGGHFLTGRSGAQRNCRTTTNVLAGASLMARTGLGGTKEA